MEAEIMNPIDDYMDELDLTGKKPNTMKNIKVALKKFRESCNDKGILEIDEDDVKKFIRDMKDQKINEFTLLNHLRCVNRFYSFVIESQKYGLKFNPVSRLSRRFSKKRPQTKRPIKTVEDIAKFIRNIHNPRDRAIVVLFAKTGIRNGELVALNIEDIDFDNETLTVDKHVGDNNNKILEGRKNGNESTIPLDEETIRTLKFYLMTRPETENNALFISHVENVRLYVQDVSRIVKDWSIKLGMCKKSNDTDKKIVPHFFRAWATFMLQINGCNPVVIDAIRGDVASTMRAFYVNQVLPFDVIKKEYLKAVPKFGI